MTGRSYRVLTGVVLLVAVAASPVAAADAAASKSWDQRLDECLTGGPRSLGPKEILLNWVLTKGGAPAEVYDYLEEDPFEEIRSQLIEFYNIASMLPQARLFDRIVAPAIKMIHQRLEQREARIVRSYLEPLSRELGGEITDLRARIERRFDRWNMMDANYPDGRGQERDDSFRREIYAMQDEKTCLKEIKRTIDVELELLRSAVLLLDQESERKKPHGGEIRLTVILIDRSASMKAGGKVEQAERAMSRALDRIAESSHDGTSSEVAVLAFGGGCSERSVEVLLDFTPDLEQARHLIETRFPEPRGTTPLPQAISVASKLIEARNPREQDVSNVVLLSDGESTCGSLRPPGRYSGSPVVPQAERNEPAGRAERYMAIGLELEPGSAAERDLTYLASMSGGRYLPAANQRQLTRAFEKLTRRYVPKSLSSSDGVGEEAEEMFSSGARKLGGEQPGQAGEDFLRFLSVHPTDPAAHYNLALALDASGRYLEAADHYERYLELAPDAVDRAEVEREIRLLHQDHLDHRAHQVAILRSDLEYLERYYESLFHRTNSDLAIELAGFVREREDFYVRLPEELGIDEPWLERDAEELSAGFGRIAARLGEPTFDRDAVSLLTLPIGQLQEIVERLEKRVGEDR